MRIRAARAWRSPPSNGCPAILIMAQRFVAEVGAEVVGLFPQFGVAGEEGDEVGGADAQRLRGLADAARDRLEDVEGDAGGRPEAGVLAAEVEAAVAVAGVAEVGVGGPAVGRLGV